VSFASFVFPPSLAMIAERRAPINPSGGFVPKVPSMWHFYNFNRNTFLEHYHERSNVETAFSMIKMKFGASVRAKTPIAQVNEVLCKILCHNTCVLINSIYELGIEPTFWSKA